MKTITKQNKLGTYLTVTVGAGCAANVAAGAIQVIDISAFDGPNAGLDVGDFIVTSFRR
jgi:hypothetical protein